MRFLVCGEHYFNVDQVAGEYGEGIKFQDQHGAVDCPTKLYTQLVETWAELADFSAGFYYRDKHFSPGNIAKYSNTLLCGPYT